jgi:hypothetical protein
MFKRSETTKDAPAKPESVQDPRIEKSRKPYWPKGIQLSKSEKQECFIPDDLKVILTRQAFEQVFGYAYAAGTEISCLGMVRREGSSFVIERFHLVQQDGGSAHTEMDPSAIAQLMEQLLAQGKAEEARSIKCWAHSHPGMGVFWSKTDDNTCALLASDFLVSIVVSDGFAIRCRIDTRQPVPFTIDKVPVFCETALSQEILETYAKEVAEKVKVSFGLPAAHDTLGQRSSIFDDEPWSDYYRDSYGLFDGEETAELEAVHDDPEIPF